jgi:hypothetical protein
MSRISILIVLAFTSLTPGFTQNKAPRVFALDAGALQANKSRVLKKDAVLMPAYKLLIQEADAALSQGPFSVMEKKNTPPSGDKHDYMSLAPYFWPDPSKPNGLPYMRKDGQTNPEVKDYLDKDYQPKMIGLVHTLALAYYFSNDERYAQDAALLLKTWFLNKETRMNPNLNYGQAIKGVNEGRGAGLIDTRHYIKVVDAIGLIQTSKHWSKEDQEGMKKWFSEFLHWMQTSKNGIAELNTKNNHGVWYDAQRLSLALYIDSMNLSKKIVKNATQRLNDQMDKEGKFPAEMARTTSLHYSSFALLAFFNIAEMAEHTGFDFWHYTSPNGNSLKKGFNTLKPFISQEKEWKGEQIKPYDYEEDALPLLFTASTKLSCNDCNNAVERIAGKKAAALKYHLLF